MLSSMSPSGIEVYLGDAEKWEEFYPNTEMIVTKKKGRVIFPHLSYHIKGLNSDSLYTIFIHLERVDNIKYKYDASEWKEAGRGDPVLPIQLREHPDGARPGSHWMKDIVSFAHLKITNNPDNTDQKLILAQSMHKYRPVVTIMKVGDYQGEEFRLKATEFMVVTAYQSDEMIKLKVKHNKFASGFRANGKRRNTSDSENISPSTSKRHSTSSDSYSSGSPTVSVSPAASWDQPLNNPQRLPAFNHPTPPLPAPFPFVPNQFPDFNAGTAASQVYFNPYYQGNAWNWHWNQMQLNMNQWNAGPIGALNNNYQNNYQNL